MDRAEWENGIAAIIEKAIEDPSYEYDAVEELIDIVIEVAKEAFLNGKMAAWGVKDDFWED